MKKRVPAGCGSDGCGAPAGARGARRVADARRG